MDTVNRAGNPDLNRKMPSPFSGARPESSARRYKYIQAEESQSSGGALQNIDTHKVARGLGWLSLALGAAQLLFPRGMRKVIGAPGASLAMMRIFGLREIASGAMIFVPGRSRALGLWSRVAGDAINVTMLASAYGCPIANKTALKATMAGVLGVTAVDILSAREMSRQAGLIAESGALRVSKSITVNRPPQEVYEFWRQLENLSKFMVHVESIVVLSPTRSRWTVKSPAGGTVDWAAEITADRPGEMLSWRSTDQADVVNTGMVSFERRPGGRGTIVRVELEYRPPGSIAGAAVALMFNRNPGQQIDDDLRRFKQFIETGDIVRSDGSPEGTGRAVQRAGRPSAAA